MSIKNMNKKTVVWDMLEKAREKMKEQIEILCRDIKNLDNLQSNNDMINQSNCLISGATLVIDLIIDRIMKERDQLEDIIEVIDGLFSQRFPKKRMNHDL